METMYDEEVELNSNGQRYALINVDGVSRKIYSFCHFRVI